MAKKAKNTERPTFHSFSKFKKTGQGGSRKASKQMMNKHKRRGFKAYRGQGK